MSPISVVILTYNESERITGCVRQAQLISDNIIIVDSGSRDRTPELAGLLGCTVLNESWAGYGNNKNKGIKAAKYDWILSIDADEIPDDTLIAALQFLKLSDPQTLYDIPFKVFFQNKAIRFGSFGSEHHIRLFNRSSVKWAHVPVHETLDVPVSAVVKRLPGYIYHYAIQSREDYERKMLRYARLSAQKYFNAGKKATFIKRYFSPVFNFVKNYIFRLGFADGKEGFIIAVTMAWYTWLKYHYLYQMNLKPAADKGFSSGSEVVSVNSIV